MTPSLLGRRALVTGAASGIGASTARRLAENGAVVALVDRDQAGLKTTVATIGGDCFGVVTDVTDEDATKHSFEEATTRLGGLDILVANAGVQLHGRDGPVHELDKSTWDQTIGVNLTGVFLSCKYGLRPMIDASAGSVIITGSPTGLRGGSPRYQAYSASKGGVFALMRVMAVEYGSMGIRVNAVVPGFTETPLVKDYVTQARRSELVATTPLGRAGTAEDVAAVIAFLASDDSAFVTGSIYACDGGMLAG